MKLNKMTSNGEISNKVQVVLGAQWGDEGKGKLVDLLAENANVVARCQVSFFFLLKIKDPSCKLVFETEASATYAPEAKKCHFLNGNFFCLFLFCRKKDMQV